MRSAIPGNHLKRRPCRKIKATPNPITWIVKYHYVDALQFAWEASFVEPGNKGVPRVGYNRNLFYWCPGNFTKKERTWQTLTYSRRVGLINGSPAFRPVSFCTANTNEVSILTMTAIVKDLTVLLVWESRLRKRLSKHSSTKLSHGM